MAAASSNARPKKTYNFSAAQAEIRLKKPQIEIDLGEIDGKPASIIVDPTALWPDEVSALARKGKSDEASKLLMGEEQYELWRAAGGTWGLFNSILEDHQKATLGESGASKNS